MKPAFEHLPREKQLRILNAAMKVFARNDYRHASTDDIAAQAGIPKGLLFYYFHNKKQLYLFCYDQAVRLVDRQLKAMQAAGQTDFFELLLLGGQAKVALMEQCPWLLEFSLRAFESRDEEISRRIQDTLALDLKSAQTDFFTGMDFSRFRPEVDPQEILRMITWMTAGYLDEKRRTGTPVEPVRVMEEFSRWLEHFRKISYKEEFL